MASGSGIYRLVVGNRLQLKIPAGAAQSTLLAHHGGNAIGFLAFGSLLFPRLLAVLETP